MITDDEKMILEFLYECRSHRMIQDELFKKEEAMFSLLHKVENIMSSSKENKKLYTELESSILDVLDIAKETYFEYGSHCEAVSEKNFFSKIAG